MYFALIFKNYRSRAVANAFVVAWRVIFCALSPAALLAQNPAAATMEAFIPSGLSARVGDTTLVPVLAGRLAPAAQNMRIDSCRFVLRFNPTVLAPLPSRAVGELSLANNRAELTITLRPNRRLRENDVIGQIPMIACLGDMEGTELAIDGAPNAATFRVFADGADSAFAIPATNGFLRIENARWNGALRTINANIGQLSMTISPNPVSETMTLELSVGSLPPPPNLGLASLAFYAPNGREILVPGFTGALSDRFIGQSFLRASFQRPPALRGTLFARFAYGGFSLTRIIIFE